MTGKAPPGTRTPGRRLWTSVVDAYELDEHELTLLREAVRTVDLLEHLDANGPLVERWGPPAADCPHWLAREPGQPRSWQQVHATRAWLTAGERWGKEHGYPWRDWEALLPEEVRETYLPSVRERWRRLQEQERE